MCLVTSEGSIGFGFWFLQCLIFLGLCGIVEGLYRGGLLGSRHRIQAHSSTEDQYLGSTVVAGSETPRGARAQKLKKASHACLERRRLESEELAWRSTCTSL